VGAATQSSRVNLAGRSSVSFVERSAQPVGAKGERLPPWSDMQGGATYDDLKPAFEAAIVAALGSFRPGEAEVRRMYADHVRVALQAGDLRAARQSLIWSQPALVGTDVASLQAFRRVFLADGAESFPRAWSD
jgi:hypothetical protein